MAERDKIKRRFFLGAPLRKEHYETYETILIGRFSDGGDPKRLTEKGVDYIHRALDRQINKARGLLTYNALLVAAINTVVIARTPRGAIPVFTVWSNLGRILALASCIPLLVLFYMNWGAVNDFSTADADFKGTYKTLRQRTYFLTLSIYATLFSTLIALRLVLAHTW